MINWNATKEEDETITQIAVRANRMAVAGGGQYDVLDANMDIAATHCNGCPLKLDALLRADDFNFAHDVFGIRHHINRNTGKLEEGFDPRYAQ